jgi:hypothetical protein
MKQLVIMPGGFHPFHAGHLALYQSALQAFPGADVKVAATNDTSNRPFPFKLKEKLAQLAGVPPGDFYQVKSPFRAEEITKNYDPADTQLIFVRSKKDADKPPRPGGILKNGSPAYLQPISRDMAPMTQHAYMTYLPTVTFGPGMQSATEIRTAWPELDERRRMALVMSLYPHTQKNPKLAKTVVKMLDTAMGAELTEVLDTKAGKSNHAHWNTSDPDMVKFNFAAGNGVEYQLDFLAPYIGPENMSPYDYFDSDEVFDNSKFVSFEQLTNDMKGGFPVAKQGIEGTGSAAEVFGIVVHAIIQYVKKARPALLYFQAAEPNRRALYARMIQRVLPSLPGWSSMSVGNGEFGIYNRRAIKSAMGAEVKEATGDKRFDSIMSRIRQEPTIPDARMPPTDVKDLYHWAVENHKPYHKIFAKWANREGYKSVAPALLKAGNLDSDALDYWTPDVWKLWFGPDAEMPRHWSKERVPDELRDYLETVFDAYENIWQDWPNEYRQIKEQVMTDTDGPGISFDSAEGFKNSIRQKLGSSDPELNANVDQLVVADPDGTVDVDQTLFNMVKEFDQLMPQILQFVKDITAKFIETSQSIEFQQASPADQQSLLQSTKDMQAMLPGLEKQVADARAKFQQNAPIMQQNIQTKAAAAKPAQPVVKEVTRQMSQGGLRASYQAKYNQPMMEDYLDEARS